MTLTLSQIEHEALKLNDDERAQLFERLLHSLAADDDAESTRLWAEEALRRDRAIEDGREVEISSDEVFAALRARLG